MFTKLISGIVSFFVLIGSIFGFNIGGKEQPKDRISFDSGKTTAIISLPTNPSTGYDWKYEISDPLVLKAANDRYIDGSSNGMLGASVTREVSFVGLTAGTANVTFNYLRTWENAPIETIIFKITVAADLTLTAEEIPDETQGEVSTNIEEIVAAYNAAHEATQNPPQGKLSMNINGSITGDGFMGAVLRMITPIAKRTLANNDLTTDYIPGYPPILVSDVVEATSFSKNGVTTIRIKLQDQIDDIYASAKDGPVGRGVGTLGSFSKAADELGAEITEGSETISITYQNASIMATIDESTGTILGGVWQHNAFLHVENAKVRLKGWPLTFRNINAMIDFSIVI